jgi:hypothetical protein
MAKHFVYLALFFVLNTEAVSLFEDLVSTYVVTQYDPERRKTMPQKSQQTNYTVFGQNS